MPGPTDENDPVWGRSRGRFSVVGDNSPYMLQPARLREARDIPPRRWLYGTTLVRGFVSVLVAPGGTGKSLYAMAVGLSCAMKRSLLGDHVFEQTNVALINLDDPMEELERRLAALAVHYNIKPDDIDGRFFMNSGEDRPLVMSTVAEDGFTIIHPDEQFIISEIEHHGIGVLIVDPYAESHTLEENSNPMMVKAAAAWRRIARVTNCAVFLIHHVRKGAGEGIDAARGAKALTDSARVGQLLTPMTTDEAAALNIREAVRSSFIRLDNAKANLAPKGGAARWFELVEVELGNTTEIYPNGDRVAVLASWTPPDLWAGISTDIINETLDHIAEGPGNGTLYSGSRSGRSNDRWVGKVIMETMGIEEDRAKRIVTQWTNSGLLMRAEFKDEKTRMKRVGVEVDNSKRPGALI